MASPATLHVASNGNDANDGSSDKPFATLTRARDVLRTTPREQSPTVVVHGGTYVQAATLQLTAADSGTLWQTAPGDDVRVTGGPSLPASAFRPINDQATRKRITATAQNSVMQLDLRPLGNVPLGEYPQSFRGVPATPELFFNDKRMTVARWPNKDWATIASIVESGSVPREGDDSNRPGVFAYSGDEPSRWDASAGVWLLGYWCFDWYDEAIRVKSIDRDKRQITLAAPALYGLKQGNPSPRRFRALNVLEELDEPGEFYIDRTSRVLYFWPPQPIDAKSRVALSTLDGPLLRMNGAERVTVRGMTFEATLGNGIEVNGGKSDTIAGCIVRNTRLLGIRVIGGSEHHVDGCEIYDTGTGGLVLQGGDRKTLTAAHHEATNNHIHDFSRHQQASAYGVTLGGVGNRVANNLIERAPHQAVFVGGNDHLFELNIVRNVVTETDDAGAVYKGRDPSCRGNVIRHNLFTDIGSPRGAGNGAIYFDDGDGGDSVIGNVFVRCGDPGGGPFGTIFSHGGHDIRAENNIFVDCKRALGSAPWDDALWKASLAGAQESYWPEKLLKDVDITRPPYTTRYPELVGFMDPKPGTPRVNHARNNVIVRAAEVSGGNWTYNKDEMWVTNDDPGFVDPAHGNYQLRSDAEVFKRLPGFQPIPLDRVGPHLVAQ